MNKEERDLVEKARNGESEAFGVLYDKYFDPIYRFIYLKTRSKVDAEDISHQVFLSAWQRIEKYEFQGFPFSSWLYKIASNAVIDHWRTKKPDVSIDLVKEDFLKDVPDFHEDVDRKLKIKLVGNAITRLEPDQQNVIIMKFVDELSNKEIAGALDKTEGAIRVIQHRALRQLKKTLEEDKKQKEK
jgi:RNA polymerase sigma-70 factor (ECF subfamily)